MEARKQKIKNERMKERTGGSIWEIEEKENKKEGRKKEKKKKDGKLVMKNRRPMINEWERERNKARKKEWINERKKD